MISPSVPLVQLSDEDLGDLQRAIDLLGGCVGTLRGDHYRGDDTALTVWQLAGEARATLAKLLDRLEGERARAHEQARHNAQAGKSVGGGL